MSIGLIELVNELGDLAIENQKIDVYICPDDVLYYVRKIKKLLEVK